MKEKACEVHYSVIKNERGNTFEVTLYDKNEVLISRTLVGMDRISAILKDLSSKGYIADRIEF